MKPTTLRWSIQKEMNLAARVWVNKYAVTRFGNIYEKSPEDMHWRIANEVSPYRG